MEHARFGVGSGRQFPRFDDPTPVFVQYGVAGLIVLAIVGEADGEGFFRLLGASAFLDAANTVVMPVLHRLSRNRLRDGEDGDDDATPTIDEIDAELARLRARIEELERLRETSARPEVRVMQTARRGS